MADKKLLIKLAADVESLKKGLREASSKVDSFAGQMKSLGPALAAAFSAKAIGAFVLEISKLAGEAQGVREAFERLPNSVALMRDLKEATGGTVDELQLMKRSVMASNFDISLQALPKLLEFATIRARQTGQSVDYLVDSIVTGIGRKSKLILDNLGISAVQLTEALGGASAASASIADVANAVGKIIDKSLPQMGKLSENAVTKIDRLSASWTNLKVVLGDAANGTGLLGSATDQLSTRMDLLASKNLPFWIKTIVTWSDEAGIAKIKALELANANKVLAQSQDQQASITRQAQQAIATFGEDVKAIGKAYAQNVNVQKILLEVMKMIEDKKKKVADSLRNEKNLTEQLNSLREESTLAIGKERASLNKQINAIEKEIKSLQDLGQEKKNVAAANLNFSGLAGKNAALPKVQEKDFGSLVGMSKAMFDKFNNDTKSLIETSKNVEKARAAFEGLGMATQNGLAKASAAYAAFIKDGNLTAYMEKIEEVKQKQQALANFAFQAADAIGQGFGDAISGAKSWAKSMGDAVKSVINQLKNLAMAYLLTDGIKKFGIAGAIAAGIGLGVVGALFNRIGEKDSNAVNVASRSSEKGNGNGAYLKTQVSGRNLNIILTEQRKYDSHTSTIS